MECSNVDYQNFTMYNKNDMLENLSNFNDEIKSVKTNNSSLKSQINYFNREAHNAKFIGLFDLLEEDRVENQISMLASKIASGKTLSPKELEFLRRNAPDLYELAMKIKAEVEAFEEELKKCSSKEDVERLMLRVTLECLGKAEKAQNSGDGSGAAVQMALLNAFNEAYNEFKTSNEYEELKEEDIILQ